MRDTAIDLDAYSFFRNCMGYPASSALALARAEVHAVLHGWRVEWTWSDDPWDGDSPAPKELYNAILRDADGEAIGSLGMIGDPDQQYRRLVEDRRLVEAELALEVWEGGLAERERELARQRACQAACAL